MDRRHQSKVSRAIPQQQGRQWGGTSGGHQWGAPVGATGDREWGDGGRKRSEIRGRRKGGLGGKDKGQEGVGVFKQHLALVLMDE